MGDYAQWLVSSLESLGMVRGAGESLDSLPFSEITAWASTCQIELTGWEAESIRDLSSTYLASLKKYEDENATPPYLTELGRGRYAKEYSERRMRELRG